MTNRRTGFWGKCLVDHNLPLFQKRFSEWFPFIMCAVQPSIGTWQQGPDCQSVPTSDHWCTHCHITHDEQGSSVRTWPDYQGKVEAVTSGCHHDCKCMALRRCCYFCTPSKLAVGADVGITPSPIHSSYVTRVRSVFSAMLNKSSGGQFSVLLPAIASATSRIKLGPKELTTSGNF